MIPIGDSVPLHPVLRARLSVCDRHRVISAIDAAVRDLLHELDVVVFRHVRRVLHLGGAVVRRHRLYQILDKVVGDEGVAKIELRDVRLWGKKTTGLANLQVGKEEEDKQKDTSKNQETQIERTRGPTFPSATSLKL